MMAAGTTPFGARKPLSQRLRRPLPRHAAGRREQIGREAWKALANAARLAAASPESDDAAFDLAGARNGVRHVGFPSLGGAAQGAALGLLELIRDWPEQGLERRLMFAPAIEAAGELVERLIEEAALGEAAFARRMCGSED